MLLDTPICDFGWKAPDFTLSTPNGDSFSLHDYANGSSALVMFICNHCPYVVAIAERLAVDTATLQSAGVKVLAVMSNDYKRVASDSPANMEKFSQKYGFTFPYLVDEAQSVGKTYGAICTPDFFGFNANLELQYRGRFDDARMSDSAKRTPELLNAMQAIAETGQGPREQVPSMGCSIKWSR